MGKTWTVNQSDCSKVNLLNNSDDNDAIWLENTWHEVSPTQVATLPSGTKMVDQNDKELTLLDGYCTTYFYKGWQTVSSMKDEKIGNIIHGTDTALTKNVGLIVREIDDRPTLQVVRLRDNIISLPNNMGKNLIPDLYPGRIWTTNTDGTRNNWYNQWKITPLVPPKYLMSPQTTTFPRIFSIDETNIPGYGTDTNKNFYAPELFAPYMLFMKEDYAWNHSHNGLYFGGLIVVIGVKKLS